jgi:hypothetical protein
MSVEEDTNQALCGIYDFEMRALRRGAAEAVVIPDDGNAICIIRPWAWPTDGSESAWPALTLKMNDKIGGLVCAPAHQWGATDFGSLLIWASRRTKAFRRRVFDEGVEEGYIEIDRSHIDAQSCAGAPFNRRLIREAIQTFVEVGTKAADIVAIDWLPHAGGSCLRMRHGDVMVMVMSLKPDTPVDGEPLPVEWGEP